MPFVLVHALLLLAGDVEVNPGPTQGKKMVYQHGVVASCLGVVAVVGVVVGLMVVVVLVQLCVLMDLYTF